MSVLANLKLIFAKRQTKLSPVMLRRQKLVQRLGEQIEMAKAKHEGISYAPMKQRTVTDAETGDRKVVQIPKRIKPWWFVADNGKVCVSLRYGAKVIEIAKGKTAVELATAEQLVSVLETLKTAVEAGELDVQLDAISGATKAAFKK